MNIIEVVVTAEHIAKAKKIAQQIGELRNSIRKGSGNFAGILGEVIAAQVLGATHENTYDYDLKLGTVTIDVKTKDRTVEPKPYYFCSVADCNTKQNCEQYLFVSLLRDKQTGVYTKAFILGMIPKTEFYQKAVFYRKGEIDPSSGGNFPFRADCYNLKVSDLNHFADESTNKII